MPWIRVNKEHRCSQCGQDNWCSYSKDGAVAICMREPSDRECKSGGWIHVIDKSIGRKICKVFTPKKPRRTPEQWHKLMIDCCSCMRQDDWYSLSNGLRLSLTAMRRFLIGKRGNGYTFPMWNGFGKLVGLRVRALSGEKWSVKDSQNGLFIPVSMIRRSPLLICEGCTDPIAALELGFDAIGRASCNTGLKDIKVFLHNNPYEKVIIVSDNDEPKKRKDGSFWFPGQEGAWKLCKQLTGSRIIKPPVKDLRQWYNDGCTRENVLELINA